MQFPKAVEQFARDEVTRYDDSGEDVSVGYNQSVAPYAVAATVYVYPGREVISVGSPPEVVAQAKDLLDQQEFEAIKQEVLKARPGTAVIWGAEAVSVSNPQDHTGRKATFGFEQEFGGRRLPARSELYLFGLDDWFVEYRFTYPAESQYSVAAHIRDFMSSLYWPEP